MSSEGSAQLDHAWANGFGDKAFLGALSENILQLFCIIGSEKDIQLTQSRPNTRVEEVGELEVVGDADDACSGGLERGIHVGEVVQQVIPCFPYEMVDFVKDDDKDTASAVHASDKLVEHAVRWPSRERDFVLLKILKQRVSDVTQHPVLGVDLTTVHHDGLHLAPHGFAFGTQVMADVVGDSGFSSSGDTVQGHVAGDVTRECLPKVVGDLLNFFLTMWEALRSEIMTKVFLVFEEGFLGNELVKDVGLHVNSPPYLYQKRGYHLPTQRHVATESESPLYACPRKEMGGLDFRKSVRITFGYKDSRENEK